MCIFGGQRGYRFELLPGPHAVSAEYLAWGGMGRSSCIGCPNALFVVSVLNSSPTGAYTYKVLGFNAEAGHTYDIGPFWIKDTTTGEFVLDGEKVLAEKKRENHIEKFFVAAEKGDPEAQFQLYTRDKPDGKSLTWLCLAANQGHALAQEELGDLHVKGLGQAWREAGLVELDPVRAYVWYSLAATNGNPRAGFTRDYLADQMTPEQIAEAERLAAEWKPRDCGAEDRTAESTK